MTTKSNIEWTEMTWSPVVGCSRVSAGCDNCYAVAMTHRLEGYGQESYQGLTVLNGKGDRHFSGIVRCLPERLRDPIKRKKPTRYFVNSMSDLFHDGVPFEFVDRVFATMACSNRHTYQVLTKRPNRMAEYFDSRKRSAKYWKAAALEIGYSLEFQDISLVPFPLPNVWLGTSVENQDAANERIPLLLQCKASVRFLSCEPLLDSLSLREIGINKPKREPTVRRVLPSVREWCKVNRIPEIVESDEGRGPMIPIHGDTTGMDALGGSMRTERGVEFGGRNHVDWVIVGGESGPGARPMNPDWARSIRDQCKAAGIAFFMKQMDKKAPIPDDLMIREYPR